MEANRWLHSGSLDTVVRKCELVINGRLFGPTMMLGGVHWRLCLLHDCAAIYVSLVCADADPSRRLLLVDANLSLVVPSRNASEEHPYADAIFRPEILEGVTPLDACNFFVCDFERLDDFVDARGLLHVEFWLAFRKVFFVQDHSQRSLRA
ncbi:hypothetical protein QR680_009406 [Steinernema hermaphroditum]|uniref:MATH domain-containing protein n=1 Tax=Steinernema hermaphroditum TaxID=289476 RepID=A0AA39IMK2_9BILA|nr:hypothetical protein QR680_009406 [Steinernema hermaphroditum]